MPRRTEELREFLRARRDALRPSQVGLPNYPGRRVPGLRREEIAQLAGVSADYYTRLEQGRLTSASEGVVASLAEALQLSAAETDYLRNLLRPPQQRETPAEAIQNVRPGLRRLIDGLTDQPAFVLGRRSEVLAANDLLEALLTPFSQRHPGDRSLLRWMLLEPSARTLYVDWAQVSSEVVGVLRAEAARHPGDVQLRRFIAELTDKSEHFRTWWDQHSVEDRTCGTKHFNHPVVGELTIDYEALTVPEDPDQVLFIYSPRGDSDRDALSILASWYRQRTARITENVHTP